MLSPQTAYVGREERRAPLKTPAWEASNAHVIGLPRGRPPGQLGEYVGEYNGIDWTLCPWGGENSSRCFKFEGIEELGWANCIFGKIAHGNHGDIMGIYRKKGFIKGEALRLLRTYSVRRKL